MKTTRIHSIATSLRTNLTTVAVGDTSSDPRFMAATLNAATGDPRLYVCQAPGAFICVSPCGSILGPFWVHSGSILGPFEVHLESIWGPFGVYFGSILLIV